MNHEDWGGQVEAVQLAWLEAEIADFNAASQPALLVVLAHHPLANTTFKSEKEKMNIHNSAEVWATLAKLKRGQGFFFNGHNHTVSLARREQWHFVQAGAPYRCVDYRLAEITPLTSTRLKVEISTKDINNGLLSTQTLAGQLGDAVEYFSTPDQPKGPPEERHLLVQVQLD
jgi:hypothetical protein